MEVTTIRDCALGVATNHRAYAVSGAKEYD